MNIFKCMRSPADHIGVGSFDGRVLVTVVEQGQTPGELTIQPRHAEAVADIVRTTAGSNAFRDAYGLWVGATEDGVMLALNLEGGVHRSVVLAPTDVTLFAAALSALAVTPAAQGPADPGMLRRAAALALVTRTLSTPVDPFAAAAWVAGEEKRA